MNGVDAAVILVAGVGQRLRPLTDDRPKALMELGGETILARALRLLLASGVHEIVLATGYREDQIRRHVEHLPAKLAFVPNPEYESTQNSVSLLLCRHALENRSFFKLDGDVVFRPEVLTRLKDARAPLAVAVDSARELDDEAMKVRIVEGKIRAFGKGLGRSDSHAETIGIELLGQSAATRVFETIDRAVRGGRRDLYYEAAYSELVESGELEALPVEVGDLAWSEVDTLADLERARGLVASE